MLGNLPLLERLVGTRWYLLGRTVPYVIVSFAARFLLADVLRLEIFSKDLVSGFAQSAIFVLAILISGVLEDYKEAEAMPADLASELMGMSERVMLALPGAAEAPLRRRLQRNLLAPLETIFTFLGGMHDERTVLRALSERAGAVAVALRRCDAGDDADAVMEHAHNIRRTLNRLYVIKRTDFLQSGAALMELLVWITVALTVTQVSEDGWSAGFLNVGVTALQFFYVIELLRDIDDPFEYDPPERLLPVVEEDEASGEKTVGMKDAGNSAEVDPFPLMCVGARAGSFAPPQAPHPPPSPPPALPARPSRPQERVRHARAACGAPSAGHAPPRGRRGRRRGAVQGAAAGTHAERVEGGGRVHQCGHYCRREGAG